MFSLILIFCLLLLVGEKKIPSMFFLLFLIYMLVIPTMVLWTYNDFYNYAVLAVIIPCIIVSACNWLEWKSLVSPVSFSIEMISRVLLLVTLVTLLLNIFLVGLSFSNFNLINIYDFREEADLKAGSLSYINSISTKVFVPFLVAYSISRGKRSVLYCATLVAVLMFFLTGNRATILMPFLAIFIVHLERRNSLTTAFPVLLIVVVLISYIDIWLVNLSDNPVWGYYTSFFIRRGMLVPSVLNAEYINFFTFNAFNFWSDSRLTIGVEPIYEISIARTIGNHMGNFGSANSGLVGSGFAQAGFFGVFIYSVFLGFFLSFLDSMARKLGNDIVVGSSVVILLSLLIQSDLLTVMLSHGGITLVLIFIVSNNKSKFNV